MEYDYCEDFFIYRKNVIKHLFKTYEETIRPGTHGSILNVNYARNLDLPIDIQTKLFESIVCPILLYGSEVWRFKKMDMLEIFYKTFFNKIIKLRPPHQIGGSTGKWEITTTNIR